MDKKLVQVKEKTKLYSPFHEVLVTLGSRERIELIDNARGEYMEFDDMLGVGVGGTDDEFFVTGWIEKNAIIKYL